MTKRSIIQFVFFSLLLNFSQGQTLDGYQQINLVDTKQNKLFKLDLISNQCFEFPSDGQQESRTITFYNVKKEDLPPDFVAKFFQFSPNKFLITIQGTGQTYEFDTKNCLLSRIDKTYYRGYNFGAIQFIRRDTLISLGGHGFWRIHNISTYFHKPLNEWEIYGSINEKGPKGISSQFGGYSSSEDQIYCLEFPLLYLENNNLKYPFYAFNFKGNNWTELGYVDFSDPQMHNFNKCSSQWIPPYFFTSEITLGEFIDPKENKIYRYQGKNNSFFNLAIQLYIKGQYIYSFQRTYNQNNFEFKLDSMSLDQLKKNSRIIGNFYTPKIWYNEIDWNFVLFYGTMIIIAFLIIGIYLMINHRRKRELKSWKQLPEQGEIFLTYLSNQSNYTCTTEKLNEILQCEGKTIESQRQSRSKFISSINLFFERNYGCHDAISRHQSENDKRFVNYVISQEAVTIYTRKNVNM